MNIRSPKIQCSSRDCGFTLVELLIVIVIIAVLAALSLTGIKRMRESADKTTSMRNISQLHIANALYATDNNGDYVPIYSFDDDAKSVFNWYNNPKFLSNLKSESATYLANGQVDDKIPLGYLDPVAVKAKKNLYDFVGGSYGYVDEGMPGGAWQGKGTVKHYRISQLGSPDRTAAFITSTDWIAKYGGRFLWKDRTAVEGKTNDGKIAMRHRGKALVVYYDGHVGELTVKDLVFIDLRGGATNLFWNGTAN